MDPTTNRAQIIANNANAHSLLDASKAFMDSSVDGLYCYQFDWMGRPIIQYPQDIVAFQEIVYLTKPGLIIETGIAHGGSLMLSASLLCILDVMEGKDPRTSPRMVIGVDIDIRSHNRKAIEEHPLRFKLKLIEGSSVAPEVVAEVKAFVDQHESVLVCLDSNHTHEHVLAELNNYATFVTAGSYCIVYDTMIENLSDKLYGDRPWSVGNNPMTAVNEFIEGNIHFAIDHDIDSKLQIGSAPNGYLRRR